MTQPLVKPPNQWTAPEKAQFQQVHLQFCQQHLADYEEAPGNFTQIMEWLGNAIHERKVSGLAWNLEGVNLAFQQVRGQIYFSSQYKWMVAAMAQQHIPMTLQNVWFLQRELAKRPRMEHHVAVQDAVKELGNQVPQPAVYDAGQNADAEISSFMSANGLFDSFENIAKLKQWCREQWKPITQATLAEAVAALGDAIDRPRRAVQKQVVTDGARVAATQEELERERERIQQERSEVETARNPNAEAWERMQQKARQEEIRRRQANSAAARGAVIGVISPYGHAGTR